MGYRSSGGTRTRYAIGGTAVAGALAALLGPAGAMSAGVARHAADPLPVTRMERALRADGQVSKSGVLEVDVNRSDLHVVGGTPARPFRDGFQIQHETYFQSLAGGRAIVNGDFALRPREIQPVIDAIQRNHLVFQAEHQHLYDAVPMVWFVHFRGVGAPVTLAEEVHAVMAETSTPLPQRSPSHPTTPLPAGKIARILGGDATVGDNGVLTVSVPRTDHVTLGGVRIDPDLGVSTQIQFEPLGDGRAVAVPDFGMTAGEIPAVTRTMRAYKWEDGCLYNQETAETPQLYFSHMYKTGDPVMLAHQIRAGLNRMATQR